MLAWNAIGGPDILLVSSLAKAFGVPVAVLSGSKSAVEAFEASSETRMHCSPPSIPVIHAAEHALTINHEDGDRLRLRLSNLVARFRQRAADAGFRFSGGLFPFQTLLAPPGLDTIRLFERLGKKGIRTVLHQDRSGHGPRISFLISARHLPEEIDQAVQAMAVAEEQGTSNVRTQGVGYERRTWV